ncbi:hypothetical protein DUI87_03260 [Hirundo rustica rustica]|uniref:ribonuclease H n=1 Tax=Hirundo rustica rustica TaxID=333673 RepID=A0A3M0L3M0_HIRRU|nr:hypothetical protein DUI87_03260 [Hirundo rustica rustica]
MAVGSVWKGLVGLGLFALAHAAFSAAQHRSYMRLTEKEDETLPIDIVLQTLMAFAVTCYGIAHIAGEFKDMDATSELKNKEKFLAAPRLWVPEEKSFQLRFVSRASWSENGAGAPRERQTTSGTCNVVPKATGVAPRSEAQRTSMEHVAKGIHAGTAIELQVKKEGAQEQVLEEMALANANKQCKAAILSLPMEPAPTLDDMLQWYLSSLLSPVRAAAGEAIILHYMDDVLVCAPNDDLLSHVLDLTIHSLVAARFELQGEKIQRMPPWKYLGLEIGKRTIVPQKLVVKNNIKTLADVQQLCGSLNWSGFSSVTNSKRMTRPQELVAELIRKARTRIRELAGCAFECIHIPIEMESSLQVWFRTHVLHAPLLPKAGA